VLAGHGGQALARRDHQGLDGPQPEVQLEAQVFRDLAEGLVHALEPLQIAVQAIDEDAVQHLPGDFGDGGVVLALEGPPILPIRVRDADDHHPVRSKVQGRTDGSEETDGAITKEFPVDLHRREEQGDGARSHQVVDVNPRLGSAPVAPLPGLDLGAPFIEAHGFAGVVARAGHGQREEVAPFQGRTDLVETEDPGEQVPQRGVVQQGTMGGLQPAGPEERHQPLQAGYGHAPGIGTVDLLTPEVRPDVFEASHAHIETRGVASQHRCIDGARG